MVAVVLLVMMVVVWVVVTGYQRVLILCWIYFLTCILTPMFSSIRASSTLLVHLTLFTNYYPNWTVNDFDLRRSFYSKQSLKGICYSSVCIGYKWALQHKATTVKANYHVHTRYYICWALVGFGTKQMTRILSSSWYTL